MKKRTRQHRQIEQARETLSCRFLKCSPSTLFGVVDTIVNLKGRETRVDNLIKLSDGLRKGSIYWAMKRDG